jgi:two-component system response regulator YesN
VKLLVVDDEQVIREGLAVMLPYDALDIRLTGLCADAFEALDSMTDDMPDVLMADVKMPRMDGLELIDRALVLNPALQCVVLSGFDEFTLAQRAMRMGVREYLLKPCSRGDIEQCLGRVASYIKPTRLSADQWARRGFVGRMRSYIHEHYDDPRLSVQFLANHVLFMNADYIGKEFARETGERVSAYLLRVRMERARELIALQEERMVYEVAEQVGFANKAQYFSSLFRKHTGMTPKEYRRATLNP